jgi:fructose-specific phosphotransferase system IIB component
MNIIAVTSCPTGIAHTYMAAAQLEKAAKKLGHSIKVETQGSMGI